MTRGRGRRQAPRAKRLDARAWIAAALEALAAGGIEAVRVEPLAKALAVTKGSFYWHFADRRELIDAVVTQWTEGRVAAIRVQASSGGRADAVLRRLARLYTHRGNVRGLAVELAIRGFAHVDGRAALAVRRVDRERLDDVARLFVHLGWSDADARARAVLFYSYLFGQSLLDGRTVPPGARERAVGALLTGPRGRDRAAGRRQAAS